MYADRYILLYTCVCLFQGKGEVRSPREECWGVLGSVYVCGIAALHVQKLTNLLVVSSSFLHVLQVLGLYRDTLIPWRWGVAFLMACPSLLPPLIRWPGKMRISSHKWKWTQAYWGHRNKKNKLQIIIFAAMRHEYLINTHTHSSLIKKRQDMLEWWVMVMDPTYNISPKGLILSTILLILS